MTAADTAVASWDLYRETRDRFISLVRPLDDDRASTVVPITPGWTVAEVLAHLCGLNSDVADGLREGLGTDERTALHVSSREGRTVAEVCTEWIGHGAAMVGAINEDPFFGRRLAADLVVHLHDVQHALDQPIDRGDDATVSGGRTYALRMVDEYLDSSNVNLDLDFG
ncbi:MAG: maleylpyruvate isomerase N-terminal domain-containing protein, partial [Actinomycetota bacterium]